jgi:SNF family Na+-dependent transporter
VPCLGWLNWFALIFGKISLVTCIVALVTEKDPSRRSKAVVGLVVLCVALGVAVFRLILSLIVGGAGCV